MQFIDLGAQQARIKDRLDAAIGRTLSEGQYILGPQVAQFEEQLADYLGVRHVVACANGTDALLIPLMAAGIGPGDAVFCPSFTFAATAEVVVLAGAEPVFVDVEPDGYTLDASALERAVEAVKKEGRLQPRAVIPVDLFGRAADYAAIGALAEKHGLLVLEDAAQAMGGRSGNGMCGSFGHAASTSFYPAKPLGCYGDGGAIMTNDDERAELYRSIAFHGKGESQYDNVRIGLNSRLDTLQAAILIEKLAILDDEVEARQKIANRYDEGLQGHVRIPPPASAEHRPAGALYAIETPQRDALKAFLQERDIPSVIYYVKPLHLQPAYGHYGRGPGGLPVSERLPGTILCLPMHPYLESDDQDMVIGTIHAFCAEARMVAAE